MAGTESTTDGTARERILAAAEELFAESGFEATPTARIAERAGVPKGLVHYYFRRKTDLLVALIERLPGATGPDQGPDGGPGSPANGAVDGTANRTGTSPAIGAAPGGHGPGAVGDPVLGVGPDIVVPGDIAASLRRLVAQLDARTAASPVLSHLLWREADTHHAVRDALQARYRRIVEQIRAVILAARGGELTAGVESAVDSAAELLALAISYRHSVARHRGGAAGRTATDSGVADPAAATESAGRIDKEVDFLASALSQAQP